MRPHWRFRLDHDAPLAWDDLIRGAQQLDPRLQSDPVVRREDGQIRRYVHIGTGNYNAGTARAYTDLGLLSADPALGDDLSDLFNQLTGSSRAPGAALRRLLVAPEHLLPGLLTRIGREVEHARSRRPARIRAKLNGLDDPEIIRALYDASEAGVEVDRKHLADLAVRDDAAFAALVGVADQALGAAQSEGAA